MGRCRRSLANTNLLWHESFPPVKVQFRLLFNEDACATEKTAEAGRDVTPFKARFLPLLRLRA